MATNLTPQYHKAEEQYRRATTTEDELKWLEVMLREMPKHKASEKLQSELKQKISRTKKNLDSRVPGVERAWRCDGSRDEADRRRRRGPRGSAGSCVAPRLQPAQLQRILRAELGAGPLALARASGRRRHAR